MIAKHESKSGSRVYNQFNAHGDKKELPNFGPPAGWGIAQIDKGPNGDSTAEVYDWHENVASMNEKLRNALATHKRFVGYFKNLYADDPSTRWFEPDDVVANVNGCAVSATMWSVLTFYNGADGCPKLELEGRERKIPIEFVPSSTNWVFHANSNNYVHKVTADRDQAEMG